MTSNQDRSTAQAQGGIDLGQALDGNAAAGEFTEIFSLDVTTVLVTCGGCGSSQAFAQLQAYLGGPGTVLRCRNCSHMVARVAKMPAETWLDLSGCSTWRFPVPPGSQPSSPAEPGGA
jgi:hypothetical protein